MRRLSLSFVLGLCLAACGSAESPVADSVAVTDVPTIGSTARQDLPIEAPTSPTDSRFLLTNDDLRLVEYYEQPNDVIACCPFAARFFERPDGAYVRIAYPENLGSAAPAVVDTPSALVGHVRLLLNFADSDIGSIVVDSPAGDVDKLVAAILSTATSGQLATFELDGFDEVKAQATAFEYVLLARTVFEGDAGSGLIMNEFLLDPGFLRTELLGNVDTADLVKRGGVAYLVTDETWNGTTSVEWVVDNRLLQLETYEPIETAIGLAQQVALVGPDVWAATKKRLTDAWSNSKLIAATDLADARYEVRDDGRLSTLCRLIKGEPSCAIGYELVRFAANDGWAIAGSSTDSSFAVDVNGKPVAVTCNDSPRSWYSVTFPRGTASASVRITTRSNPSDPTASIVNVLVDGDILAPLAQGEHLPDDLSTQH